MGTIAPQSMDDRLRFAIANRRLIEIRYNGRVRVVEPHDYGLQKGTDRLLAYQLRETGGPPRHGWRLFDVSKVESCRVLEETFPGSRGQSHSDHYEWEVLYARVA